MISLHKSPTISQLFLRVPIVCRRAWYTINEKKTLKVKLQESDQRYGKQIYNSVNGIFNDYSTHLSEKNPNKNQYKNLVSFLKF